MQPRHAPKLSRSGAAVQIAQLTIPTATAWRAVVNVQGKNAAAEDGRDWKHHGLVFSNDVFMLPHELPVGMATPTGH